jgi:N-acylneuraminate cytidylyltransferase
MTNIIAIILARGRSKSIPKKNIVDFCGKPLISWTIEQAKNVKMISKVWVSSDDEQILSVAKQSGAQIIKRPKHLSTSRSSSVSGWMHAINEIEKIDKKIDIVIGLQATSPVRESADIVNGIKKFISSNCDSLFSASIIGDFFIWKKQKNRYRSINYNYHKRPRRQEFADQYVENGSFYIFTPELIKKNINQIGGKIEISLMEFWKSFEIDEKSDLEFCEIIMKQYLLNKKNIKQVHKKH